MKKVLLTIVLCLAVIATGGGFLWFMAGRIEQRKQAEAQQQAAQSQNQERVPNVKVQVLDAVTVEDALPVTGAVEPWEEVLLSAETTGQVERQGVEEGDQVQEGQELIAIDAALLRAQVDQASAQHKLTIEDLERVQGLHKDAIASVQELDRARTQREVAEASLRTTQIQLENSVVKAPFAGVVDKVFVEQEEFVDRGAPLVRLVQVHQVKVRFGIPERDISFFRKGAPVGVSVDALPGRSFQGAIYRLATTADLATRTFRTEVELDNAEGCLKPGMIARARLVRHTYPNAISIPLFAVVSLENKRVVFVEEQGLAQMREVEVGVFQGNAIHITRGLAPGDRLIVEGHRDVRAGMPVRVTEEGRG